MIRKFIMLLLLAGMVFPVGAQELASFRKKDLGASLPDAKGLIKTVKRGDDLFRKGVGFYPQALKQYLKVYDRVPTSAPLNYRIGLCYLYTDHKAKALSYIEKAYALDSLVAQDILYRLGQACQYRYEFNKALEYYRMFLQGPGQVAVTPMGQAVRKRIGECESGLQVIQDTVPGVITNLGGEINSEWDDYKVVMPPEGDRLFFTSRRIHVAGQLPNRYDGKFEEDIYLSRGEGNGWSPAGRMEKPLNTRYNDAALAFSPDGKSLFVYYGKKGGGDILMTSLKNGHWKKPAKPPWKINSRWQESSLCISSDSSEIYFVSANRRLSHGGKDIFVIRRDVDGKWSKPEPLDTTVNTPWDEESPWLTPDGKTLYFSSQGHNSMGGFDVFRSHRRQDGSWGPAENLGVPLNTPDDDLFYMGSPQDSLVAYVSGVREDTYGWMDIYQITWTPVWMRDTITPTVMQVKKNEAVKPTAVNTLSLAVPVMPKPRRRQIVVTGTITDKITGEPVMASIDIIEIDKNEVSGKAMSSKSTGRYVIRRDERKSFGVEINAPGYMFLLDMVEIPPSDTVTVVRKDFRMKKIKVGETVVLQNIFFETNKAVITPVSYPALDRVINFMRNNPGIKVEIDGHTDSVGSDAYNLKLSQARAQAVVDYLVQHGIPRERLVAKGFGESQPVAPNTTPEGRAKNRRVEFKILEME